LNKLSNFVIGLVAGRVAQNAIPSRAQKMRALCSHFLLAIAVLALAPSPALASSDCGKLNCSGNGDCLNSACFCDIQFYGEACEPFWRDA